MHNFSLVASARNPLYILVLALLAPSCGTAEHVAPNSLNVQEQEKSPNNSLYRHHDIMLEAAQKNDVFGLVMSGPEALAAPRFQEPAGEKKPAVVKTERVQDTPQLAQASAPARAVPASSRAMSPIASAELWRVRVYEPAEVERTIVFDHAGIAPKIGAMRPSVLEDEPAAKRLQKPLRKRPLTRLNGDGEVIRTHKKPGSVI